MNVSETWRAFYSCPKKRRGPCRPATNRSGAEGPSDGGRSQRDTHLSRIWKRQVLHRISTEGLMFCFVFKKEKIRKKRMFAKPWQGKQYFKELLFLSTNSKRFYSFFICGYVYSSLSWTRIMYFHDHLICQQMTGRRLPLVWLKIVQVQPMWTVNDDFGIFPPLPLRESFKNDKLRLQQNRDIKISRGHLWCHVVFNPSCGFHISQTEVPSNFLRAPHWRWRAQ